LSEQEFLTAAERISRMMGQQRSKSPDNASNPDRQARRRAKQARGGVVPAAEMSDESMPVEEMPAEER
jgi:hypothetical protein